MIYLLFMKVRKDVFRSSSINSFYQKQILDRRVADILDILKRVEERFDTLFAYAVYCKKFAMRLTFLSQRSMESDCKAVSFVSYALQYLERITVARQDYRLALMRHEDFFFSLC